MPIENHKYFDQLLIKASIEFRKIHPEVSEKIADWKGEDITLFRDQLYEKVGGSISEKWFYTHVKNRQEKLPRVDALNIIAKYAGYKGWKYFLNEATSLLVEDDLSKEKEKRHVGKLKYGIGVILLLASVFGINQYFTSPNHYHFCFIDRTTRLPLANSDLQVRLTLENESPLIIDVESNCFEGEGNLVEFIVKGNYYKPQIVKRNILSDNYKEEVMLVSDDYARIIYLFSTSNIKDWKKRRNQLKDMMHDNAKIYHINKEGLAIELYNKSEFINQLTLPTQSLKSIDILETAYQNDKIIMMRFTR